MRIKATELMFGVSAVRVRYMMRRWGWGGGGVQLIAEVLPDAPAHALLDALLREGYVARRNGQPVAPGWE